MDKRKLLLAEGNEELAMALEEALRGLYTLRVCRDGQTALQLMHSFKPDILVLDMMLPGLDGISLLQSISEGHLEPMVLVTTRYHTDYMLERLSLFGVSYLMVKPCDIRAMVARIGDLNGRIRQPRPTRPDPRTSVSNLLLLLRVPAKRRGYVYLREAVLLMEQNPGQSITKELYPAVGALCGAKRSHVERCIRTAIEAAWNNRDEQIWRMYFSPLADGSLKRPSNGEFIARMADCLSWKAD